MATGQSVLRKGLHKENATYNGTSWEHRYSTVVDGKIRYRVKAGFATSEEANDSYWEYKRQYEKEARAQGFATRYGGKELLKDFLIFYYEELLKPVAQPSTITVYYYTLYNFLLPHIDDGIELKGINSTYLNKLLDNAGTYTKSAKGKAKELLSLALNAAKNEGLINEVPRMKKVKRNKKEIVVLSKEQLKVLLNGASDSTFYLEILLGVFCGLRKGEILGLKISDFNREESSVSISRQVVFESDIETDKGIVICSGKREKPPKTENSYRTLYVPQIIWDELDKRKKWIEENKKKLGEKYDCSGYISCQENGETRGTTSLNKKLGEICEQNGLPHVTPHGLRHIFATILIEHNYQLPVISAALGHSSITTTYEIYADVMSDDDKAICVLNDLYPEGE